MGKLFNRLLSMAILLTSVLATGLAMADDGRSHSSGVIGSGVSHATGSGIKSAIGSGLPTAIVGGKREVPREEFHQDGRHHPRIHFGVVVVGPVIWPGYAPSVYADPNYVPGSPMAPAGLAPGYWYYCASAAAYYPYVYQCPEGWQQVMPPPPPSP